MKKACSLSLFSIVFVVILSCSSTVAQTPDCSNIVGAWHNDLTPNGSTLTITNYNPATGSITGTYQTGSGATGSFPLVGWVNEERTPTAGNHVVKVISFMVRWGDLGSVTSWSGYCTTVNGVAAIKTQWYLVRPSSKFTWDHVLAGSDTFTPGPAK